MHGRVKLGCEKKKQPAFLLVSQERSHLVQARVNIVMGCVDLFYAVFYGI